MNWLKKFITAYSDSVRRGQAGAGIAEIGIILSIVTVLVVVPLVTVVLPSLNQLERESSTLVAFGVYSNKDLAIGVVDSSTLRGFEGNEEVVTVLTEHSTGLNEFSGNETDFCTASIAFYAGFTEPVFYLASTDDGTPDGTGCVADIDELPSAAIQQMREIVGESQNSNLEALSVSFPIGGEWGQSSEITTYAIYGTTYRQLPPPGTGAGGAGAGEDSDAGREMPDRPAICFVADTPVTMADGSQKSIQDIVFGDHVLSYNPETEQLEPARVTGRKESLSETIYTLNGTIEVTGEHPFFVFRDPDESHQKVNVAYRGHKQFYERAGLRG